MTKTWKRFGVASGIIAVALAGMFAHHVMAQPTDNAADKAALRQIKSAYENAINNDDMGSLSPFIASSFSATMATGQKVQSFDEFKAYWKTMKTLVGIGPNLRGKYEVSVEPIDSYFLGNYAFSFGTSKETLVTDVAVKDSRESKSYKFNSTWYSLCVKDGDLWKLMAGHVVVDPFHSTFSEAKVAEIASVAKAALKTSAE